MWGRELPLSVFMPTAIDNISRNMVIIIVIAILVCAVLAALVYRGKIRQKGPHNRDWPS